MASEPTEEAITSFISFTSTTREQAIAFLKGNNLDSQKAINAYFEDPTGSQLKKVLDKVSVWRNAKKRNCSRQLPCLPEDGDQTVCEANLFALVSNFIGHVTSTFLMGEAFVENSPNLAEDLGRLDDCFVTLFAGTPRWVPHPAASAGHAASDRLRHIFSVFHRAFTAWDDGIDAGIELRDLDDVSELVKDRMRTFRKLELSPGASAAGHLSLYYDLIEHTTKITFWTITHLFAEPSLLDQVRKEIAPYVVASRPPREETGFPFDEPPRLSLDIEKVLTSCPLFRACYYETVRLHSAGISFKKLASDVTLSESAEEAAYGLTEPRTYKVAKGEDIIVPHGAHYHDARYFSNPEHG
ncbi:hypothetical protein HAV15_010011 [Penicillium sp. str. |nr:hypothetical protein HAV15_010011 [Penicillium sp. str. \